MLFIFEWIIFLTKKNYSLNYKEIIHLKKIKKLLKIKIISY